MIVINISYLLYLTMNIGNFDQIVVFISNYGYLVILLIMIAEGPMITTAAAFAAGAGVFNIWVIFLLSIFGDTIADALYFSVGYWGQSTLIKKYKDHFDMNDNKLRNIQNLLHKNALKTLILIKLTPALSPPGLIAVGVSKMPVKQYIKNVISITIPKCLFFTALGYYSERVNDRILKYFRLGIYGIPLALFFIFIIVYLYNEYSAKVAQKIGKIK